MFLVYVENRIESNREGRNEECGEKGPNHYKMEESPNEIAPSLSTLPFVYVHITIGQSISPKIFHSRTYLCSMMSLNL